MKIDFHRKWIIYGSAGVPAYLEPTAWTPAQLFFRDSGISNETLVLWKGEVLDWLFDEQQLEAYAIQCLPRLMQDGWRVFDRWQEKIPAFETVQRQIMRSDLIKFEESKLRDLAKALFTTFTEQYVLNNWIEPISFYFQQHLSRLLQNTGLSPEQAKLAIEHFGSPVKKSYVKRCLEAYQAADSPKQIQSVLDEFYYIKNDYTGAKPLTQEGIQELVGSSETHARALNFDLPTDAKKYLEALQMTATVQDLRKEYILKWVSAVDKLLHEIAKRQGISPEVLEFATWTEIMRNGIATLDVLENRTQQCVVDWRADAVEVVDGAAAHQLYEEFKRVVVGEEKIHQLKGMPASTGKVTGRAVVVLHPNEFSQVKPGDVLITVMTRPEYLPVMKLAAAFVTDEGGITSHAAIVAREMKKPCVIATKKATKVIQTGQQVEVDANIGVVSVL